MIKYGSETIPDLQIVIPDQFKVPEVREHLYVPGSGVAEISLFGMYILVLLEMMKAKRIKDGLTPVEY